MNTIENKPGLLALAALAIGMLLPLSQAQASGTTEASDAVCDGLQPTIYVENNQIIGGPLDGKRYKGKIRGTNGDDVIFGTDSADQIQGYQGNDIICAFGGNDRVTANEGDDTVYGGSGNDRLYGQNDEDTLVGGTGDDRLFGGDKDDVLDGGEGFDRLAGDDGSDTCSSGEIESSCENDPNGPGQVIVVDVVDTPIDAAIAALAPLSAEPVAEEFSDTIAAGNVISQNPAAGVEVAADTVVELTVSLGASLLVVADVVDTPLADAFAALAPLDAVQVAEVFSDTIAAGNVISQNPAAGVEVAADTVVELTVSLGAEPEPQAFAVSMRVTEADGTPISNATVSNSSTGVVLGTTGPEGNVLFDVPDVSGEIIFRVSAAGFGDQIVPLDIVDGAGSANLDVTMAQQYLMTVVFSNVWTATSDSTVSVEWSPDSFVTPAGDAVVDGDIEVMTSPVDVSNPAELEAFPGSFTGIEIDGTESTIASLGTAEYVFMANGTEVQLAPQATATISLPLYIETRPDTGELLGEGSMLPIWSLEESTGVWIQETEGTVVASENSPTGLAVEAEVSHFSWWNIDVPMPTGEITVAVNGNVDGTVTVRAIPSDIASGPGYGSVPIGGSYTTQIPSGTEYCFSGTVRLTTGQSSTTDTVCRTVGTGGSASIELAILGIDAPLDIATNIPVDNSGSVTITGFVGVPIQRLDISPLSFEAAVNYNATNLPAGINLLETSAIDAELAGAPTESGTFNVTVTGTADGESDSVNVLYEISGDDAPAQDVTVTMFGSFEQNTVNLNDELSVPATSFEFVGPDTLPEGLTFDEATGEFFIPFSVLFNFPPEYWAWTGLIKATFPGGTVVDYNVTFVYQ